MSDQPKYVPGGSKPADKLAPVPAHSGVKHVPAELPSKDARLPCNEK